jgi:hypothetical protein
VNRNGKPHLPRFEREKRVTKNHSRNKVDQQELEFINQSGWKKSKHVIKTNYVLQLHWINPNKTAHWNKYMDSMVLLLNSPGFFNQHKLCFFLPVTLEEVWFRPEKLKKKW